MAVHVLSRGNGSFAVAWLLSADRFPSSQGYACSESQGQRMSMHDAGCTPLQQPFVSAWRVTAAREPCPTSLSIYNHVHPLIACNLTLAWAPQHPHASFRASGSHHCAAV